VPLDLSRFHGIEWDDEDDLDGNLVHCRRAERLGPFAERIVFEVLSDRPVAVTLALDTAEAAFVGPDRTEILWLLLVRGSTRRGDLLRPVTGWRAELAERHEWQQGMRGGRAQPTWLN